MVSNHRSHMKMIFKDIPISVLPQSSQIVHTTTKKQRKGLKRNESAVKPESQPQAQPAPKKPYKKKPIPVAIREATWVLRCGRVFEHKCLTTWCPNMLTVFEFQAGHDIPESKGGATKPENLYPICSRCNQSMGNRYTFKEWCEIQAAGPAPPPEVEPPKPHRSFFSRYFSCWKRSEV